MFENEEICANAAFTLPICVAFSASKLSDGSLP
jgi:hypothetical protein